MNKSENKEFGQYLRNLRETRDLSSRMVEEKAQRLFPNDSHHQISQGHLTQIERGDKPPPHPLKLKALSQVYGENYEFMLFKAGYLDRNPVTEPQHWGKHIIRDLYFEQLAQSKNRSSLSEEEKKSLEKLIDNGLNMLVANKK